MSQEQVGEAADDMHPAAYGRIERNERDPVFTTLRSIAKALRLSVDALIHGDDTDLIRVVLEQDGQLRFPDGPTQRGLIDSKAMRIFSGIQPTGRKHLGNFIGAIVQYVEGQQRAADAGDVAIYCVVDLHAMTVPWQPAEMRERVYDTAAILLAAGLDPEKCIFIRQSDIPEHTELTWTLGAVTAHGDLNRMHQFKEKSAKQKELVSADLFTYPVLMAADVLAYRANEVPVGDDQRQHVELMRDVAIRFNERFGETLVVPELRIPAVGARIMDLQNPTSKMSTSSDSPEGTVYVLDDAKTVEKKFKRAVTDSDDPPRIAKDPSKPGVSNLIDILAAARGITPDEAVASLADARGYGDLKMATADAVNELLEPVRTRYAEIRPDEDALEAIFAAGAEKARGITREVMADVRAATGVGPRTRVPTT